MSEKLIKGKLDLKLKYRPQVFDVKNEDQAKRIILTPEGSTTEERWEKETPFLVRDICSFAKPDKNTLLLDFGAGIGRISKGLITATECNVIGLDISQSMRDLSVSYVSSERFSSMSKELLMNLARNGLKVDVCISIWVLQHCPRLDEEIELIKSVLKKGGHFYILNGRTSSIPTNKGWVNNGVDIKSELEKHFNLINYSSLPKEFTTEALSEYSFIGKYLNP